MTAWMLAWWTRVCFHGTLEASVGSASYNSCEPSKLYNQRSSSIPVVLSRGNRDPAAFLSAEQGAQDCAVKTSWTRPPPPPPHHFSNIWGDTVWATITWPLKQMAEGVSTKSKVMAASKWAGSDVLAATSAAAPDPAPLLACEDCTCSHHAPLVGVARRRPPTPRKLRGTPLSAFRTTTRRSSANSDAIALDDTNHLYFSNRSAARLENQDFGGVVASSRNLGGSGSKTQKTQKTK